jgi:hypothetical protein
MFATECFFYGYLFQQVRHLLVFDYNNPPKISDLVEIEYNPKTLEAKQIKLIGGVYGKWHDRYPADEIEKYNSVYDEYMERKFDEMRDEK